MIASCACGLEGYSFRATRMRMVDGGNLQLQKARDVGGFFFWLSGDSNQEYVASTIRCNARFRLARLHGQLMDADGSNGICTS